MNTFDQNRSSNKTLLSHKLRTQMLVGYAIPVIIFGGAISIVYTNANKVFDACDEVETLQQAIIQVDNMALAGSNMVVNNQSYVLSSKAEFEQLYQASWQNFQEASRELDTLITDPEQKRRIDDIHMIAKYYDGMANEIFNLIKNGKKEEAMVVFNTGKEKRILADFLEVNHHFNETATKRLYQENLLVRSTLQTAINLLIISAFVCIVTALIVAWIISSLVSGKINQVINAIDNDNSPEKINIAVAQQQKFTSNQALSINEITTVMDQLVENTLTEMDQTKDKVAILLFIGKK